MTDTFVVTMKILAMFGTALIGAFSTFLLAKAYPGQAFIITWVGSIITLVLNQQMFSP